MKAKELKELIKESVREAIQDELKDILLEALKSSKSTPLTEVRYTNTPQVTPPNTPSPTNPMMSAEQRKNMYENALGETAMTFTSNDVSQPLRVTPGADSVNGQLPQGEVDLSLISGLMNAK